MQIVHGDRALTPAGWQQDIEVVIDAAGRIASVGAQRGTPTHRVPLLLPAPVNLHSHAFQRAMAGLTEARGPDPSDSFWSWRRLMYRFLDQLTPDHAEAIAALVFMEMQEAGYGAVAEFHYLHHDVGGTPYAQLSEMSQRIVAAADQTGIGMTLLPVLPSCMSATTLVISDTQLSSSISSKLCTELSISLAAEPPTALNTRLMRST